jgi:hypothetical protein
MFRPFTGSSSGLYNNLQSAVHVYVLRSKRDPVWFTVLYITSPIQTPSSTNNISQTAHKDTLCVITFNPPSSHPSLYKLYNTVNHTGSSLERKT